MDPTTYHTYRDLPPLAGLCSVEEASRPGLGIEWNWDAINRYSR